MPTTGEAASAESDPLVVFEVIVGVDIIDDASVVALEVSGRESKSQLGEGAFMSSS